MAEVGRIRIGVDIDRDGLRGGLNGAVDDASPGFLGRFDGLGRAAAIGFGAAFAAAGAAAGGLFALGSQFDDAFDAIRIQTGAQGEELAALEQSWRNVVQEVPTDFDSAAEAIGQLNSRLDLAGEPLEALTGQFLQLSNVTGGDLAAQMEVGTRALGDWGIAAEDSGAALDMLFRGSQETGTGFDQLASTVTQFGGPLRQLGFTFEESIALVGRFNAEGVNTELVLGGMRQSLGRMARAGEDPIETFERVTNAIRDAGSAGEANALALELFGARAGPDMAAAIREGRFEIEDLTAAIAGGSDTIVGAAEDTADFSEKWQLFRNRVMLALEPLAMRVFDAVGEGFERLAPHLERFVAWLTVNLPIAFAAMQAWWDEHWPQIRQTVATVIDWIELHVVPVIVDAFNEIREQLENLREWWDEHWAAISEATEHVVNFLTELWRMFGDDILDHLQDVFNYIQRTVENALAIVRNVIELALALINGEWGEAWDAFLGILSAVWDQMLNQIRFGWERIKQAMVMILQAWWALWWGAFTRVLRLIRDVGLLIVDAVALLPGLIVSALDSLGRLMVDVFRGAWDLARDAVTAGIEAVIQFHRALPDRLIAAASGLAGASRTIGTNMVGGIVDGLSGLGSAAIGAASTAVTSLGRWIIGDGYSLVRGFGSDLGDALQAGFSEALTGAARVLETVLRGIVNAGIAVWNSVDLGIPGFHIPSWVPEVGGRGWDGVDDLFPDVRPLARGGLIDSPTLAWIGERAPELVLPITDRQRSLDLIRSVGFDTDSILNDVGGPGGGNVFNVTNQNNGPDAQEVAAQVVRQLGWYALLAEQAA